jgi:hypothetical protein
VPPAADRFQVSSGLPVQSLLLFKRFVNHICSALYRLYRYTNRENIPREDEAAYDCAANGRKARSAFT